MRSTRIAAVLLIAALAAGCTSASEPFAGPRRSTVESDWRPAASEPFPVALSADFELLAAQLDGQLGLAVMAVGDTRATVLGDWHTGIAWSTIKVPIAVAALRNDSGPAVAALAEAAITLSDNAAAGRLWYSIGSDAAAGAAVHEVLAEAAAGSSRPAPEVPAVFGITEWSLTDQVWFASRLPCMPGTAPVRALMADITHEHRWGLGRIPGARFKGGWGPDDDTGEYLVRQFGLVPAGTGWFAVALAAAADSGSFEDTTELLDRMTALLADHLSGRTGGSCPT